MADRQKLSKMLSVSCLTTLSLDFRKSKWPAHVSEIFQHGGSLKSSQRRRLVTRILRCFGRVPIGFPANIQGNRHANVPTLSTISRPQTKWPAHVSDDFNSIRTPDMKNHKLEALGEAPDDFAASNKMACPRVRRFQLYHDAGHEKLQIRSSRKRSPFSCCQVQFLVKLDSPPISKVTGLSSIFYKWMPTLSKWPDHARHF